jgi:uncharacterized coiled-coil protein SlyX
MEETMQARIERQVAETEATLTELEAAIASKQSNHDEQERRLSRELEPQMREVLAFAREQGHT